MHARLLAVECVTVAVFVVAIFTYFYYDLFECVSVHLSAFFPIARSHSFSFCFFFLSLCLTLLLLDHTSLSRRSRSLNHFAAIAIVRGLFLYLLLLLLLACPPVVVFIYSALHFRQRILYRQFDHGTRLKGMRRALFAYMITLL